MKLQQNSSSEEYHNILADHIVRPRCLATLPNNIEEIIKQFKAQGIEINSDYNKTRLIQD